MKISIKELKQVVKEEIERKDRVRLFHSLAYNLLREGLDPVDFLIYLCNPEKFNDTDVPLGPYTQPVVVVLIEKFEADGDKPFVDYRVVERDSSGAETDVTSEFSAVSRVGKDIS